MILYLDPFFKNKSGIYRIVSPSGNCYIGSASCFSWRKNAHFKDLRKGVHHSPTLQNAFNKYGEDCMKFEILLVCNKEELLYYEQQCFDQFKPAYNICKIAGSNRGFKHSPEARASISRAHKGKTMSVDTRALLSEAKKGVPISEEHKAKIQIFTRSPEARRANSERQKAIQGTPEARQAHSNRQKVAQSKIEVRLKKSGRAIRCAENGILFACGSEAGEWCIEQGLTSNKNAQVAINKAVRDKRPVYGLNWIAVHFQ